MGIAAGTAAQCQLLFQKAGPLIQQIPESYKANYMAKLEQAGKICAMSKDKAENVFYEKIP